MSEWKELYWEDVATLEYGKSLRDYQNEDGKYPVFGTNGPIGSTDTYLCPFPGVIIGRKGAYRGVHYSDKPFFVIDTAYYLKPKKGVVLNLKFAYYKLLTQNINALDSGSAIPSTSREDFYSLPLELPELNEQNEIERILSAIDQKISLLQRQNQTLEKIAQTLFKHWFIDFEFPDEEGEPYRSVGGRMVASEVGEVPEGWKWIKMQNLINVKDGTHDSPKPSEEGFHLITSKHLDEHSINLVDAYLISESDYNEINKRSKVDRFDILLSMIGTVGLLYFVLDEKVEFAIKNIGLFKSSQKKEWSEYIYLFLKSSYGRIYFKTRLSGTTQSYLTLGSLRELPLLIPKQNVLEKIGPLFKASFSKIYNNSKEIQTLTKTRDTLLPKLMSGQIRIQEAEKQIP